MLICPAGPPKLIKPSFSQYQNASRKGIGLGFSVAVFGPFGLLLAGDSGCEDFSLIACRLEDTCRASYQSAGYFHP